MCEDTAGCTLQPVLGVPIWSPDGEQMLLQEPVMDSLSPAYRMVYRADAGGQNLVEVGEGAAPFWLDETTYGYSRLNDDGRVELVLADIGDEVPEVWLETADLMPLAPETRNWRQMTIWNVWANPAEPGMAVLMTTPDAQQNTGPYDFFLAKDRLAGEREQRVEWLFSNDFPASSGISPFSPDGRYLFFSQRGAPIFFQEFESRQAIPFDFSLGFFVGWSPDGLYYVQWADEALTLTSPSTGQRARISYDFSTCTGLHWLEN
jgi:hypothetical protein